MIRSWIKVEEGKLSKVLEFATGQRVVIPINSDGSVKWLQDKKKSEKPKGE